MISLLLEGIYLEQWSYWRIQWRNESYWSRLLVAVMIEKDMWALVLQIEQDSVKMTLSYLENHPHLYLLSSLDQTMIVWMVKTSELLIFLTVACFLDFLVAVSLLSSLVNQNHLKMSFFLLSSLLLETYEYVWRHWLLLMNDESNVTCQEMLVNSLD